MKPDYANIMFFSSTQSTFNILSDYGDGSFSILIWVTLFETPKNPPFPFQEWVFKDDEILVKFSLFLAKYGLFFSFCQ
jgi:hypothetical protein